MTVLFSVLRMWPQQIPLACRRVLHALQEHTVHAPSATCCPHFQDANVGMFSNCVHNEVPFQKKKKMAGQTKFTESQMYCHLLDRACLSEGILNSFSKLLLAEPILPPACSLMSIGRHLIPQFWVPTVPESSIIRMLSLQGILTGRVWQSLNSRHQWKPELADFHHFGAS